MIVNKPVLVVLLGVLCALVYSKPRSDNIGESNGITFKNVQVNGYSLYTFKYNISLVEKQSLTPDDLPKKIPVDHLEIKNQSVPVLYKAAFLNVVDLDEITLEENGIKKIQRGAFENVPQLRKLTITKNQIAEITEGVFNGLPISTLDLKDNEITTLASGAFDNMKELLNINLADNKISAWDKKWFAETPLLSRVSMQHNLIQEIPSSAFINLAGDKKIGNLELTVNIILSYNKIREIHKNAFKGLRKVHNIWLDNNQIRNFEGDLLKDLQSLEELRLEQNNITCLAVKELKTILIANITYIDGNPLDCECFKTVKDWAEKNNKNLQSFYASLTCDAERIKKKVDDLNKLLKKIKTEESDIETPTTMNPNTEVEEFE